jgi:hypothetical protein
VKFIIFILVLYALGLAIALARKPPRQQNVHKINYLFESKRRSLILTLRSMHQTNPHCRAEKFEDA